MKKWKCRYCNEVAVWKYIPADFAHSEQDRYSCAQHISRGCSCMIDQETKEYLLDPEGKIAPCLEHDYAKEGFADAKYHIMTDPDVGDDTLIWIGESNWFFIAWIMAKWFTWTSQLKHVKIYEKEV